MDKNKKIIIIIAVILVVALLTLIIINFVKKNTKEEPVNLQNILNQSLEIQAVVNSDNTLEITSLEKIDDNNNVEIWAFSEPIYLGKFSLLKKDNKYYLEGLNDVLKEKNLDAGSHRLLIMQDGNSLGYIKIELNEDKTLKSNSISQTDDNTNENSNENNAEKNTTEIDSSKKESEKSEKNTKNDNKQEETKQPTTTVPEEPKQEDVKCTPQKFKNKYTYHFADKDTCVKSGDQIDAWNYFRENGIPATVYGCEEIVDECGKTYYGVYYGNTEGEKFYY